jgi:hypothetical protein
MRESLKDFSRVWNNLLFAISTFWNSTGFYSDKPPKRELKNSYSAEKLFSLDELYFKYQMKFPCNVKKSVLCISAIDRVQSNRATIKVRWNKAIKSDFVYH